MAKPPTTRSSSGEIASFLERSKQLTRFRQQQPRLLFAIDATASRQPTWDSAIHLQREMFLATRELPSLAVQLCYYRGLADFYASPWLGDAEALARQMARVSCEGGHTQIARLLRHALEEHGRQPVRALVFVGDALEEHPDTLSELAGRCGLLQLPLFLFQEGSDYRVEQTFRHMAKVSGGAWAHFEPGSADLLRQLLGAVARYAAGGREALADKRDEGVKLLLEQLKS